MFARGFRCWRAHRQAARPARLFGSGASGRVALFSLLPLAHAPLGPFSASTLIHCQAPTPAAISHPCKYVIPEKAVPSASELASFIWAAIRPDRGILALVIASAVATAFVNLAIPRAVGSIINVVSLGLKADGKDLVAVLWKPALRLLGLYGMNGLLTFVQIAAVGALGERTAQRMRIQLYSSILSQDIVFFDRLRTGDLVSRISTDVADFKHTAKSMITQGIKAGTLSVGGIARLIQISPTLSLILASVLPPMYFALNFYGSYLRRLSRRVKQENAAISEISGEVLGNIRTVRAFAAEEQEVARFVACCDRTSWSNMLLGMHIGAFQGLTNVSIGGMMLVVLYGGGRLVLNHEISGGELMTYMMSIQSTQKALATLGVLASQSINVVGSVSRILEVIATPRVYAVGRSSLSTIKGDVEFRGVHFTYPTRPLHAVLRGFKARIPAGSTVALCGQSGGGKSTVAALLEGFYHPDAGEVTLDGVPTLKYDPGWLRGHVIGYISQEPVLFAGTIMDNIRYGCPEASEDAVLFAAKQAHVAEFVERLPDKYDTVVGERGVMLSGGQRQRIAIARAIISDPKVLILDEATSALDAESERLVQDALNKLMRNRTVLIIAHRLSTIRMADEIIVMSDVPGNIVERGTHDDLLKRKGAYYRLYQQAAVDGDN